VIGAPASAQDERAVAAQLGRSPRAVAAVGHRCPCGLPAVVLTRPELPGGEPFPTTCYATCPRLNSALSTLEAQGFMREQAERLAADPAVAEQYRAAHERYLALRAGLGPVPPQIAAVSAGGMPQRVKCLHALAAQSLVEGPGVNPVGDAALAAVGPWWRSGPCVTEDA
jgi:hypothetical protein